jgi:hypothetical protein
MKSAFFFNMVLTLVSIIAGRPAAAQGREEFDGPFKSWADVKKRFGAYGNGTNDDTKALQNALDRLSNPATGFNMGKEGYTVVYLPAGTYCISATLQLKGKIGVTIIGEDPARTVIKWTGKDSSSLFLANGSAYFTISRLTWDAGNRKGMEGIGIHWKDRWNDGKSRSFASLNIEVSDNIFKGGFAYGIWGGTNPGSGTGANDSEIAIKRCVFNQCTESGIEITGFNAIDYWIWDCSFLGCTRGVRCTHGIYHLYRSFFSGSTESDMHNNNGYYLSARGCYFEHSKALSLDDGMSCNPFKRIFQDDIVIRPKILPVEYYHLGKITLMGNQFDATVDTTYAFSINTKSWCPGIYEVLSLHNKYAYKSPIRIASNPQKLYAVGDIYRSVIKPAAAAFRHSMDQTPRKADRKVFEVRPGADAGDIQSVLEQAAKLTGKRPVVHFGMGTYPIDRSLIIPAGADMQLIGDGLIYSSVILRKDPASERQQPIFIVKGPSYITIHDLQIGGMSGKDRIPALVFEKVDQPHAQVHLDQIYSHADTTLFVNGMDHLYIQKDNSFFTDGNYIVGGDLVQQGKGEARVACFGGQFARLTVKRNASFLAKDCWWEGSERVPLDLAGEGNITIDGAMIAPLRADSLPTIHIGRFKGNICLMNMYLQGALLPQPDNPSLNLLVWNVHFYYKMDVLDFLQRGNSYKGAFLGLNAQCFKTGDPSCNSILSLPDRVSNVKDLNAFLDVQTARDRISGPVLFKDLPAGVSNIFVARVSLGSLDKGIVFSAN